MSGKLMSISGFISLYKEVIVPNKFGKGKSIKYVLPMIDTRIGMIYGVEMHGTFGVKVISLTNDNKDEDLYELVKDWVTTSPHSQSNDTPNYICTDYNNHNLLTGVRVFRVYDKEYLSDEDKSLLDEYLGTSDNEYTIAYAVLDDYDNPKIALNGIRDDRNSYVEFPSYYFGIHHEDIMSDEVLDLLAKKYEQDTTYFE